MYVAERCNCTTIHVTVRRTLTTNYVTKRRTTNCKTFVAFAGRLTADKLVPATRSSIRLFRVPLLPALPLSCPIHPAAMDDDADIIYSTPLPGASAMSKPMPMSAPVPLPAIPTYPPVFAPLPQLPPQQQEHELPPPPPPPAEKPADYVYYERRPDDLSSEARARATAAKVKLQSHYRCALETAIDLNIRCVARSQREETHCSDVLVHRCVIDLGAILPRVL